MSVELVRNHSHWGAFLAVVENDHIVGVRPFAIEIAAENDWTELGGTVAYMKQNRFRGKYVFRVGWT